jgi:hypothetical protein
MVLCQGVCTLFFGAPHMSVLIAYFVRKTKSRMTAESTLLWHLNESSVLNITSLNFLNYTQLIINWADIIKRERGVWQLLGRHSDFDTYLLFVLLLFLEVVVPIPVAAVWGVGLQPLTCWDWGFESRWGHGCLSVVNIVCCQVEVSASGWSLVQRSVIDCGLSVIMYPR